MAVANEISNLGSPEELQEGYAQLRSFIATMGKLSSANLSDAEAHLLETSTKIVGGVYAVYYRYSTDSEELEAVEGFACKVALLPKTKFALGEGMPGQVAKMRNILAVEGIENIFIKSNTISQSSFALTLIPVVANTKLFGVLEIATPKPISDLQKDILSHCISYTGVVLQSLLINQKKDEVVAAQEAVWRKVETEKEEIQMQKEAVRYNFERLQELEHFEKKNLELEQQLALYKTSNARKAELLVDRTPELQQKLLVAEQELQLVRTQLEAHKRESTQKIEGLASQLKESAKISTQEANTERNRALEQQVAQLQSELATLKNEYALSISQKDSEILTEKDPSKQEAEFAQRIQNLKTKYERQREEEAERLAESQRKVQELTEALRSSDNNSDVAALQSQLSEAHQKLTQLEYDDAMRKTREEPNQSEKEDLIASYEAKLEAFSEKVKEYREKITQAHEEELNEYEIKLKAAADEIRRLKNVVEEDSKTQDSSSDEVIKLKQEIDKLKDALRQSDSKIEELERTHQKKAELGYQVEKEELIEYEHKLSVALQLAQEFKSKLNDAEQTIEMLKRQVK